MERPPIKLVLYTVAQCDNLKLVHLFISLLMDKGKLQENLNQTKKDWLSDYKKKVFNYARELI